MKSKVSLEYKNDDIEREPTYLLIAQALASKGCLSRSVLCFVCRLKRNEDMVRII